MRFGEKSTYHGPMVLRTSLAGHPNLASVLLLVPPSPRPPVPQPPTRTVQLSHCAVRSTPPLYHCTTGPITILVNQNFIGCGSVGLRRLAALYHFMAPCCPFGP